MRKATGGTPVVGRSNRTCSSWRARRYSVRRLEGQLDASLFGHAAARSRGLRFLVAVERLAAGLRFLGRNAAERSLASPARLRWCMYFIVVCTSAWPIHAWTWMMVVVEPTHVLRPALVALGVDPILQGGVRERDSERSPEAHKRRDNPPLQTLNHYHSFRTHARSSPTAGPQQPRNPADKPKSTRRQPTLNQPVSARPESPASTRAVPRRRGGRQAGQPAAARPRASPPAEGIGQRSVSALPPTFDLNP
jgi:hypothetical protein